MILTAREQEIARAILDALHSLSGGQMSEGLLHGAANLKLAERATLAEFNEALRLCDESGWLLGVRSRTTGQVKWCISDAGEAARLELR